jgi:tetratricopeptide (TPR) repeat protein
MLAEGVLLLDEATELSVTSPDEGLALARKALRWNRRVRCLRVRSAALVGNMLAVLNRPAESFRIFRAARSVAAGCPCCVPVLDRNVALLLSKQGKHAEALASADAAVEATPRSPRFPRPGQTIETEYPTSLLYHGFVRHDAATAGEAQSLSAAEDFLEALARLAPGTPLHDLALFNLAGVLALSKTAEDLEQAYALLPDLREAFKGLEEVSRQRAHLSWLEGVVCAALAETDARRGEARQLQTDARDALRVTTRRFHRLRLFEEQAAAWADLVAVELKLDLTAFSVRDSEPWTWRLTHHAKRSNRRIPLPSGRFHELAKAVLEGNTHLLRRLREATGQASTIVPYP